jgi:hypothetical protein
VNAVTDRLAIHYNLLQVLRMTDIPQGKWLLHEEIKDAVCLSTPTFVKR